MTRRIAFAALSVLLALPGPARAHGDTLDGPVVQAARQALGRDGDPPAVENGTLPGARVGGAA